MKSVIISAILFLGIALLVSPPATTQNIGRSPKSNDYKNGQALCQVNTNAKVVKDTLKVYGSCGMCKTRIETTTKSIKGVNKATWDAKSGLLVYSHDGTVTKAEVSNALVKVGHDTELGKAPDNVYNGLPACCKYR